MKKLVCLLMCSLSLLILSACGGGGGGGDPAPAPSPGPAPMVKTTTPADGDMGVIAATPIKVEFSVPMNPATVFPSTSPTSTGTFTVSYITDAVIFDPLGNPQTVQQKIVVAGTLSADAANRTFTFTPTLPLPYAVDPVTGEHLPQTFTVSIRGGVNGVHEAGGTAMAADYNASFTIWAGTQQFGTLYNDAVNGVGTDSGNNIYVGGYTNGSLGSTNPDGSGSTSDILVVKYDPNGARVWTQQLSSQTPDQQPGNYDDKVFGLAVDEHVIGSPQIVAVGYTDGTLNQASQPNPVEINPDASGATHNYCVVKYNADGQLLWATQAGPGPNGSFVSSKAFAVAVDSVGNIYVTGETYGDLRNGPAQGSTTATSANPYSAVGAGKAAIFIAKYSSTGNLVNTVLFGSKAGDFAYGIAVDSNTSPNVYISGRTAGGTGGVLVVQFGANLNEQWSMQFGSTANDHANAIAVDPFGFVYVVGGTYGNLFALNKGPDPLGNITSDIFVAKINPQGVSGSILWGQQYGTASNDDAFGVTTDQAGNVYVTGQTFGALDGNSWSGGADIFATKFAQSGGNVTKIWTRQLGTQQTDASNGIAAFTSGVLYVGGYTAGNLDSNANQDGTFTTTDYFLAKYDAKTGLKY